MRADILEAGVRVLCREGALRFTTPRVAEAAGISVGSLYQYFPNKQALLYAIHAQLVEQGWAETCAILDHPRWAARNKLRRIARLFFLAESEDVARMGVALQEAEIYFEDQPEVAAFEAEVLARFRAFLRTELPRASSPTVDRGAQLLITVLESTGKAVAARRLPAAEVARWARECADMIADHLRLPRATG